MSSEENGDDGYVHGAYRDTLGTAREPPLARTRNGREQPESLMTARTG